MTCKTIADCVIFIISGGERRLHINEGKEEKLEKYRIQKSSCKVMVFSNEEGAGGRCVQ